MTKKNLYIKFVYPKDTTKMKFAVVSFGGDVLNEEQMEEIKTRFLGLRSCGNVDLHPQGTDMVVDADFGGADEESFVTDLEQCARKHYNVKRVTHNHN